MRYRVLKTIRVDRLGTIPAGRVVELPDSIARLFPRAVELERVAEIRENPEQPVGEPSSASPAGQASEPMMSKPYDAGDLEVKPRRGRPRKVKQ